MGQRVCLPAIQPRGARHSAGNIFHHDDSEVHLQPGEAHLFLAGFQTRGVFLDVFGFLGVGIDTDLVTKFAAQHLVDGHAIHFAGDIPERFFHGDHATGLPRVTAELLDLLKDVSDAERVLAYHAALQKKRVCGAGTVANLAEPVDALVGIEPDDGAGTRPGLPHGGNAQVGNPESGRTGIGIDILKGGLGAAGGASTQERSAQHRSRCPEGGSAADSRTMVLRHSDLFLPAIIIVPAESGRRTDYGAGQYL
jgi:hypothetical protein